MRHKNKKNKNLRNVFLCVSPPLEGKLLKLRCPATCEVRKAFAETPQCRYSLLTPCYSVLLTVPCRGNYQPLKALRLFYILAGLPLNHTKYPRCVILPAFMFRHFLSILNYWKASSTRIRTRVLNMCLPTCYIKHAKRMLRTLTKRLQFTASSTCWCSIRILANGLSVNGNTVR